MFLRVQLQLKASNQAHLEDQSDRSSSEKLQRFFSNSSISVIRNRQPSPKPKLEMKNHDNKNLLLEKLISRERSCPATPAAAGGKSSFGGSAGPSRKMKKQTKRPPSLLRCLRKHPTGTRAAEQRELREVQKLFRATTPEEKKRKRSG
ncbi:hypothetical protein EYF80_039561 [Liparis tanakae]|uniref:Uncharacterized protein n=1 Tax=Liparis tanakae TaxID=230148 RepID=A0A4Z2GBY6_9TELE|nr:hypothetical protein EYF80_039561 [Liparis tanakae]